MKSTENLLGRSYPFFLNNLNLAESHYLYQVYSPRLGKNMIPLVSLTKISENTVGHQEIPSGVDIDILSTCTGTKRNSITPEKAVELLDEVLKRDEKVIEQGDKGKFPGIEIQETNNIVKSLILSLRDSLRWKSYRFTPGRFVDILWTRSEFIVFEICGDAEEIWLEPRAAYNNLDIALKFPLDIDLGVINWKPVKYGKSSNRASELNRAIKNLELNSFDRKSLL